MDTEHPGPETHFRLSEHTLAPPTASDVRMLYSFFLGRQPENPSVVAGHRRGSLAAAIHTFIHSTEFEEKVLQTIRSGGLVARDDGTAKPSQKQLKWLQRITEMEERAFARLRSAASSWTDLFRHLTSLDGFEDTKPASELQNAAIDGGSAKTAEPDLSARLKRLEEMLERALHLHRDKVLSSQSQDFFAFNRVCMLRMNGLPPLPNLIGVGAGRCGTQSLCFFLMEQPDIHISPVKEINYFGHRSQLTLGPERGLPVDSYRMFFSSHRNERVIGEISPIYLTQRNAAVEIHKTLGVACKILIQLRHPVDRFLSQYRYHLPFIAEPDLETYIQSALTNVGSSNLFDWYSPAKNLEQSVYLPALKEYYRTFDRQNLLIVEYEEFKNPSSLRSKLANFLELGELVGTIGVENASNPAGRLSARSRRQLVKYFDKDTSELEEMIGIDLSHWRR